MSDLLRLGAMGVRAYRGALGTISDNVANAQTEGYSRRETRLQESSILGAGQPFYNDKFTVGGVRTSSIERAWDAFRADDARHAASDSGQSNARLRWLSITETTIDDGKSGISARLTTFFNSADSLAANPGGAAPRRAMLTSLADVADSFRNTAANLRRAAEGLQLETGTIVTDVNSELKALGDVNKALVRSAPGGAGRASLEDERDRIIDGLSRHIGLDVTLDKHGAATLRARGTTGPNLVEGEKSLQIIMNAAADGRIALDVIEDGMTTPLPLSAGTLAGLVDMSNALASRRQSFDAIANDFATQINSWSAAGLDRLGNPGTPMVSATGAANFTVLITDPDKIAAASPGPGGTENGNLLQLKNFRGEGGVESRMSALTGLLAQNIASTRTHDTALGTRRDNAFAARDKVSAVDLDKEAAELIRFQQAYDASSKIIQVARETLQSILAIF